MLSTDVVAFCRRAAWDLGVSRSGDSEYKQRKICIAKRRRILMRTRRQRRTERTATGSGANSEGESITVSPPISGFRRDWVSRLPSAIGYALDYIALYLFVCWRKLALQLQPLRLSTRLRRLSLDCPGCTVNDLRAPRDASLKYRPPRAKHRSPRPPRCPPRSPLVPECRNPVRAGPSAGRATTADHHP